eukprot:3203283-Heterocapsa_arctica.AAC.1
MKLGDSVHSLAGNDVADRLAGARVLELVPGEKTVKHYDRMLKEANFIQDRVIAAMNLAIETPDEDMAIRE